jgi:hypothetical protein
LRKLFRGSDAERTQPCYEIFVQNTKINERIFQVRSGRDSIWQLPKKVL